MQRDEKAQKADAYALVIDDGRMRRIFQITPPKVLIGTDPECDIRLREGECSPIQAEIEHTETQLILFHRGVEFETRVEGHRVEVAHLKGGERLTLGTRRFKVQKTGGWLGRVTTTPQATELGTREYSSALRDSLSQIGRRGPFLILSAIVHLLIWLFLDKVPAGEPGTRQAEFNTGFESPEDILAESDFQTIEDTDTEMEEPEEPEEVNPALVDITEKGPIDTEESPFESDINMEGLGAINTDGGAGGLPTGGSRSFQTMVGKLRRTGLDLVVLFDSTGSMEDFLQAVKVDIEEMINVISLIVPDFRIGLITFKGTSEFGATSLLLSLTSDRYQVINFLDTIDSRGGSRDARSSVTEGMQRAVHDLKWRSQTEKVIVLIGDAPPFLGESGKLSGFARQFNGRLSTIYKNSGGSTERELQEETIETWKSLSQGRGEFAFYDGEGSVVRRLVYAALGSSFANDIDRVFDSKRADWKYRTVRKKVKERDYDWLFARLEQYKVHPGVVDGLVEIGGRYVAERVLRTLHEKGPKNLSLIPRMVHILRRITLRKKINYNGTDSKWMREQQFDRLRSTVDNAFPSSRDNTSFKR